MNNKFLNLLLNYRILLLLLLLGCGLIFINWQEQSRLEKVHYYRIKTKTSLEQISPTETTANDNANTIDTVVDGGDTFDKTEVPMPEAHATIALASTDNDNAKLENLAADTNAELRLNQFESLSDEMNLDLLEQEISVTDSRLVQDSLKAND